MPITVAVLGSTGSIGTQGLDVIDGLGGEFRAWGLSARASVDRVAEQVARTGATEIAMSDAAAAEQLRERLGDGVTVHAGPEGACALARHPDADVVLQGITGAAGLPATLAACDAGKKIALANKESMVVAGPIVTQRAKAGNAVIVPVDSEHSAIAQAMRSGERAEVARIILTASGGPFRTWDRATIAGATPADALQHPNWDMGPKITIDSATLLNKALEVVEAAWLFGLRRDQIDVVVHPQSVVHSLVEFVDGSVIAKLGVPDMKIPIQYGLTWPERRGGIAPRCDLATIGTLDFEEPDLDRFPGLGLGFRAVEAGGTMGAVLNAANEVAVQGFLDGHCSFPQIAATVGRVMDAHDLIDDPTLPQVLAADAWARTAAASS
jgi:1-deoxy-D-xylulose-5-phosphate reductoisomerase